MIPATLDNTTQGVLTKYENNYKTLNLITIALGRHVYDRVSHQEIAHDVWLKLCNTYEGSSKIKSSRKHTYNSQYPIAPLRGDRAERVCAVPAGLLCQANSVGPQAEMLPQHFAGIFWFSIFI
jgi:hypothetical protein